MLFADLKCYINRDGNQYVVIWEEYKIKCYLVTYYKIFQNIPWLKKLKYYRLLNIDSDSYFPDFVLEDCPMFNGLDKDSDTYYIDVANIVVDKAIECDKQAVIHKIKTNRQLKTLEEWNNNNDAY